MGLANQPLSDLSAANLKYENVLSETTGWSRALGICPCCAEWWLLAKPGRRI